MKYLRHILFPLIFVGISFCTTTNAPDQSTDYEIRMRLPEEPARLNPIISSNAYETQLLNLIFMPLAEFDQYTLDYRPVLVESLNEKQILGEGDPYAGEAIYDFRIREDAVWQDGEPVLASDYLFTAKSVLIPQLNSSSWLSYLINIRDVRLDRDDPRAFQVVVEQEYMLALQTISNFQIYPEHHYDPNAVLSGYTFEDLRYAEERGIDFTQDEKLAEYAIRFSSEEYSRNNILGCGPYKIDAWETGQYLALKKIDNWWGEKYAADNILFKASPDRIVYPIIADETVSLTALKDDQIDAMSINEPTTFVDLRDNNEYKDKFHFLVAPIPIYYYIAMNNQSPFLDDPRERKAVALTLDVDRLIQDLMQGTAQRTIGPIHPGKVYYNKSIDPLKINIEEAKRLLAEAGWTDTNNNGVVDSNIDGELTEMILRFFVTQRQLGRKTALIHKELAAQAGIQIDIVTEPDFPTIRKDHLSNGDFELVAAGSRMSPADYDPYQNWHSNNFSTGSNYYGYADPVSDEIIESIRAEQNVNKRNQLYLDFQARLHEQQGAIFLFSPSNLFIASKKFDAKAAERRPGFFESHMSMSLTQ